MFSIIDNMDDEQPFDSIAEGDFNQQDYNVKPEPNNNYYNEPGPNQFQEYPSKRIINDKPKINKIHLSTLIITLVVIFLILSTFFLSWYSIGIGMTVFFFPVPINVDMNFQLTEINLETDLSTDSTDLTVNYDELEEKAIEQDKTAALNFINLFRNIILIMVILLIFSIIALIGIIGTNLNFGNKNTMKKIGLIFCILTLIISIFTAVYFAYQWDSEVLTKGMPNLSDTDDDSSSDSNDIFETEEVKKELDGIGFWDSRSVNALGVNYSFSYSPGLAWYLLILVAILSLFSTVLLIDKNLKKILICLFVCSILIFGVLLYLSLSASADEDGQSLTMDPWNTSSDPEEVQKFLGTWEVDIDNSVGYKQGQSLTWEKWIFWENESYDKFEVSYISEGWGSGSMSSTWTAKDGILSARGTYNYNFEDNNTKLILTNDDETVVLNKK